MVHLPEASEVPSPLAVMMLGSMFATTIEVLVAAIAPQFGGFIHELLTVIADKSILILFLGLWIGYYAGLRARRTKRERRTEEAENEFRDNRKAGQRKDSGDPT